jgi:hypothetical protein
MLPVAAIVVPIFYFVFHAATVGSPRSAPAGAAILIPIIFVLYFVAAAVMLRLSLLLPARAVGDLGLTFKQTWNRTRGNTWRIFWGIFACTVPATILAQIALFTLVGFPTPAMFGGEAFVERMTVTGTVFMVYYLLIVPIGIGFLSHSYRHFFQADLEPSLERD